MTVDELRKVAPILPTKEPEKCETAPTSPTPKTETAPKNAVCKTEKMKLPKEVKEFLHNNACKKGLLIYGRKVYEDYDWSEIKKLNIELNTKPIFNKKKEIIDYQFLNPSRVVLFPNLKGRAFLHGFIGDSKDSSKGIPLLVKVRDSMSPKDVMWLDEYLDRKKIFKIVIDEKFFIYTGTINGNTGIFYSQEPLDAEIYDVDVVTMPIAVSSQDGGGNMIMNRYLVVNKKEFAEDFADVADKKFKELNDIVPVWDYARNIAVYDEVESFIILSACMFMKLGFPAIGLIICGGTHARKTAWLESFKTIFNDMVIPMQSQASEKGMLVTHYGNKPSTGLIFRAKFVCLPDEFLRSMYKGADREGRTQALLRNCSDYMNVIEHKEFPYSSGKGTVFATLKSSFIATDNTVFKEELAKAWQNDPASLRRFAFLKVSDATEERGRTMPHVDSLQIPQLIQSRFRALKSFNSLGEYAKFFRYGRKVTQSMEITNEEYDRIRGLMARLKKKYGTDFALDDTAIALYVCEKFWREHIEFLPSDIFERAVERIYESHKAYLNPALDWKAQFYPQGIKPAEQVKEEEKVENNPSQKSLAQNPI